MFSAGVCLFGAASLGAGRPRDPGPRRGGDDPAAQSIPMTMFHQGPERNRALGPRTSTRAIGGTAGWLIGGPITDSLGWQWVFILNQRDSRGCRLSR